MGRSRAEAQGRRGGSRGGPGAIRDTSADFDFDFDPDPDSENDLTDRPRLPGGDA
ncbi:MAG: hypothetical protein QM518_01665 [Verrucomicrobiota bacterium]|nr:hypothetical protein [Verrucomicrobiota bacterium]